MEPLGNKLFKGAKYGAAAGGVAGGVFGALKAQEKLDAMPVETVTISQHQRPIYENRTYNVDNKLVKVEVPVRNEDGSLKMETVPERTVSGKGRPVINQTTHEVQDPIGADPVFQVKFDNEGNPITQKAGEWIETTVDFNSGVSRVKSALLYGAIGMGAGAAGGALIALALDKLAKPDEVQNPVNNGNNPPANPPPQEEPPEEVPVQPLPGLDKRK